MLSVKGNNLIKKRYINLAGENMNNLSSSMEGRRTIDKGDVGLT